MVRRPSACQWNKIGGAKLQRWVTEHQEAPAHHCLQHPRAPVAFFALDHYHWPSLLLSPMFQHLTLPSFRPQVLLGVSETQANDRPLPMLGCRWSPTSTPAPRHHRRGAPTGRKAQWPTRPSIPAGTTSSKPQPWHLGQLSFRPRHWSRPQHPFQPAQAPASASALTPSGSSPDADAPVPNRFLFRSLPLGHRAH